MKLAAAAAVLLVLGCGKHADAPPAYKPGDCIPLPGAPRTELIADPAGTGLYWLEPVRGIDFESEVRGYDQLVHYDLATKRLDIVADHVRRPLLAMREGIVARQVTGRSLAAILIHKDGRIDDIVPASLAAEDLEPIDDHTVAMLADGPGGEAVYAVDLDHGSARYLMDADALASVAHGKVITQLGVIATSLDLATGKREKAIWPKHFVPNGASAFEADDRGLREISLLTAAAHPISAPAGEWHVLIQTGGVIARTHPERGGVSHALVLREGSVTPLPEVRGGTIVGAAQLGGAWWALVGHNTTNYNGDINETTSEADVCLLPANGVAVFEERTIPSRFRSRQRLIDAKLADAAYRGYQLLENQGDPVTLFVALARPGPQDPARMRDDVARLARDVTPDLGDPEIATEIRYSDFRRAVVRYTRDHRRTRVTAGMGSIQLAAPDAGDLRVRGLNDTKTGARLACSGTLHNPGTAALHGVTVRCFKGDRKREIAVGDIAPGADAPFSQSFAATDDDEAAFSVAAAGQPLEVIDDDTVARDTKLFALAAKLYDTLHVAYDDYVADDTRIELVAAHGFATMTDDERTRIAQDTWERIAAMRPLLGITDDAELTLRFMPEVDSRTFDYDGKTLSRSD